jgi:hypothetical protein
MALRVLSTVTTQICVAFKNGWALFPRNFYEKKTERRILSNRAADRCGDHPYNCRHSNSELSPGAPCGE